jgi:hypothetical protein
VFRTQGTAPRPATRRQTKRNDLKSGPSCTREEITAGAPGGSGPRLGALRTRYRTNPVGHPIWGKAATKSPRKVLRSSPWARHFSLHFLFSRSSTGTSEFVSKANSTLGPDQVNQLFPCPLGVLYVPVDVVRVGESASDWRSVGICGVHPGGSEPFSEREQPNLDQRIS